MGNNASLKGELTARNAPRVTETEVPSSHHETLGQTIWAKYKLGKRLGKGTFGEVRKARLLSDTKVVRAAKIVKQKHEQIFDREVDMLQEISHRNIVSLHDVYKTGGMCYMVVELCSGSELFANIIKRKAYFESDAAASAADMLSALKYLHGINIMHRDIKAENFLLSDTTDEATAKLIDFGFACRFLEGQYFTQICGSPFSLAPELIDQHYNHMVDMWAFGVVMYLMTCGDYPFKADNMKLMRRRVSQPVKLKECLSIDSQAFIRGLLKVDPESRLTARQALKHPFMGLSQLLTCGRAANESHPAFVHGLVPPTRQLTQEFHMMKKISDQSVSSGASVNSNIHAAVQSAQLEIEVQKGKKVISVDANEQSETIEVEDARKEVMPGSAASDEEPPSPARASAPSLPTKQIRQKRYKAAAAIQNAAAVLAGGSKVQSMIREVSAGSSSTSTKLPNIEQAKDNTLPQLHPLLPAKCETPEAEPQRMKPSYQAPHYSHFLDRLV
eukprot:TRINITY_DN34556_c0_g4_i1.p1 TRINITY_DN34556_c0_g4~~TRINITY_DN34556_c0_g4_i1.p1  ORF type:complete len:501 (-),score=93.72 TRINITY_DN34556_c0_g4_i1:189-1691(-)